MYLLEAGADECGSGGGCGHGVCGLRRGEFVAVVCSFGLGYRAARAGIVGDGDGDGDGDSFLEVEKWWPLDERDELI